MKQLQLTSYDVSFLKGQWDSVGGAAYNAVWEFCQENGLGGHGKPTEKGKRLLEEYENKA